jgi:uncharacterized protein
MRPAALQLCWAVLVAVLAFTFTPRTNAAFKPPPIQGHITDTAGVLSPSDRAFLEDRLESYRQRTGNEIAVLVVGSLEGENIDDVAYTTFNTWHLGQRGRDNGVLLVIAPRERRVRIETGKGVGGDLPDLRANDIIRRDIAPLLRQNRFRDAIVAGTDAIANSLAAGPRPARPPAEGGRGSNACVALFFLAIVLLMLFASRRRRGGGGMMGPMLPPFGGFGGPGGGGGGDQGGGPFQGGGGESGGGGSSDSY